VSDHCDEARRQISERRDKGFTLSGDRDEACVKYTRKEAALITLTELAVLLSSTGIRIVSVVGGLEVRDANNKIFTFVQTLENAIGAALKVAELARAEERQANEAFKAGARERAAKQT
jgi:hypothetical protein